MDHQELGVPRPAPVGEPTWTYPRRVLVLVVALAAIGGAYRVIATTDLGTTAALFVGLPALLAIALGFHARPETVTGMVMRGITIALLILAALAIEGAVCIAMAAPIVYLIGYAVAFPIERLRRRGAGPGAMAVVIVPVLFLALEGTTPATTIGRADAATAATVVDASLERVLAALEGAPDISRTRPVLLRLGFPVPVRAAGAGLQAGDERRIEFDNGVLVARVERVERLADRARVLFTFPQHTTPAARWVRLQGAAVELRPAGATATRVGWTISYDRLLDPAWYFAPLERYAMGRTAAYLIDAMAVPR